MRTKEVKITLDIETANSTEDALAYDIGFNAHYNDGTVLEKHSYIVKDIFCDMAQKGMQSAGSSGCFAMYQDTPGWKSTGLRGS